ncbi:MAG: HAD-IIB family hydrolase [Myxococcota bacterium]
MKPLSEWKPSGIRTVALDVDDTLTRDGIVEAVAFDALHRLRSAGYRLVAATGRPLGWAEVIAHLWPVDTAVGENGAGWFTRDEHGALQEHYFVSDAERRAIKGAHETILHAVAERLPHVKVSHDARLRRLDLAFDVGEHVKLPPADVATLEALIRELGATPVTSSVHCHAALGSWNKFEALQAALPDFNAASLVYIGDSPNDEPAFAGLANSVGVANVSAHRFQNPPAYVTQGDRGEGFAEFASHLLMVQGRAA